jgi:hypothetical protein
MKQQHIDLYYKTLRQSGVFLYPKLHNPIKINGDTVIIYAFNGGKTYNGCIDKADLDKICLGKMWSVYGFNKHRNTGYFSDGETMMHKLITDTPSDKIVDHVMNP